MRRPTIKVVLEDVNNRGRFLDVDCVYVEVHLQGKGIHYFDIDPEGHVYKDFVKAWKQSKPPNSYIEMINQKSGAV